jgi:hypothetical protein
MTWADYTPPGEEVIQYARTRGLHPETLERFRVGQNGNALTIPAFENSVLKAIKLRSLTEKRYWSEPGSVKALFNHDRVYMTQEPVLVVKGEIPVMLLDQYGLTACASTVGERSHMTTWAPTLAFAEKVIVVGDNDRDPEIRAEIVAATRFRAQELNGELRFPPEEYKDIDEWILDDPSAIEVIRQWLD